MKKFILILVLSAAMVAVSGLSNALFGKDKTVKGSGVLVTRTMDAPSFDAVEVSGVIAMVLSPTASEITIAADDNLIDYVKVKVQGGKLIASMDNGKHIAMNKTHITVTAPVPEHLRSLETSGVSSIASDALLTGDDLDIEASGVSSIDVRVKSTSCDISASGVSHIDCDMQTQRCSADASGVSNIRLTGTAAHCDAESSGVSHIDNALRTENTIN